ncbi:GDSL-like Lipase/Acylhydrolase [Pseudobutyrivibrio sp. OR37]|uniref:GDSL-type esterase/lipase family protein n=1 Tax=Pseudobutyrivibrio sp. OR37 TaxID=1798186 RepID=UPI0008EA2593|nr:GDSL-type esterase/lipase family protein [Pseudobutyrivibrio sp. OR37]SFH56483.1 GDSL-like Lipase/Acylhydrolase [Pseudobutyrivibrio sp. OR37]
MKVKGFLLLSLITIASIALSVISFCLKDGAYRDYYSSPLKTPMEAVAFKAMADGVYPWTKVELESTPDEKPVESVKEVDTTKVEEVKKKEFTTVDDSYFDDALFIGDSRIVGLSQYCQAIDSRATFFAKKSLTIFDIRNKEWIEDENGTEMSIATALAGKHYKKIYLMVGINELGTGDEQRFRDVYAQVIEGLQYLQPDATIFINSIMHVSEEKNNSDQLYNNTNINIRNEAIKGLADNRKVFYLDINEAVDDENGNLKAETTGDGVHLKGACYEPWHQYLLEHGVE